ncbi:MAG: 50S ribosomal protein L6, partial [Chlamydiia bacterium]|nr:50S ribosomal protein L6 [Chlamydiia bacterium]
MSRLGKTPIAVPNGVELKAETNGMILVKGPKGSLTLLLPEGLSLKIEEGKAVLLRDESIMPKSNFHGLFRSLLRNHIVGVSEGFEVRLVMIG